jgi:hypothetical protein
MERMKRHIAPSLFALSLCALLGGAGAAEAQGVHATVPTPVDSVVRAPEPSMSFAVVDAPIGSVDLAPVIRSSFPMTTRDVQVPPALSASRDIAAFQGRSWKMPTSRTLMIAGSVVALIGLFAVEGDEGAIMGLAGGGVAVYGLYLHYNR